MKPTGCASTYASSPTGVPVLMIVTMSRRFPSLAETPFDCHCSRRFAPAALSRRGQMSHQLPVMPFVFISASKSFWRSLLIGRIRMRSRVLPATTSSG